MADCNDPSATHAQAAAGVFGILSMIDCAVTASDSAMGDLNDPEPERESRPEDEWCNSGLEDCPGEVVLAPVVENPRPPANEPKPEMLSAPVMVNPSSNRVAPLRISSSHQLLDLISSATYSGKSERGTQFDVYHRQDGRMIGRTAKGSVDEGIWEATKDGKYCRWWNKWRDATWDCFYVYGLDYDEFRFKAIEKPYDSVGRIVPGDPEQLKSRISTAEGAPLRQMRIADTGVAVAAAERVGATSASEQATAGGAPSRQVKPEDSGVAIAAAASVGAASGSEQLPTERTSSQQKSQPEYLRVAILPFATKFPSRNSQAGDDLVRFSGAFLRTRSGLKLTYSYYQPELGGGPQLDPGAIWKGNLEKLPKEPGIYAVADKLDADLALTFFHARRTADSYASDLFSVDVYLFDLTYERMYHGSGHERSYKEVTGRLLEQLVRDRQETTGKGT